MPLMKYFIGLDAHSTTSTFAVVNQSGECILRKEVDTTEKNLTWVLDQVNGERELTFEESTISQWLYIILKQKVDRLLVCNPTYVAKKQGPKTDFRDALHLAQELRTNHLKEVHHEDSHWIELRSLISGYQDTVQSIVRSKNRLKAIFRGMGLSTCESKFYNNKDRVKELKSDSSKFVAEKLFAQIEYLEEEKLKYKDQFKKNKQLYRPLRNLITIPGIDLVRANIIAALITTPHRFKNKHKFWGYCMLVRHIQKSGGRIYGNKRIHGRRELRDVFIGAAESALRSKTSIRDYYDALRAKGVNHKNAKVATARKIAALSLSILKNNEVFYDDWEERQRKRVETRKLLNQHSL